MTSTQWATGPTPGTSRRSNVSVGVHSSHACRSGTRVSNTNRPPGRSLVPIAPMVAAQSSSSVNTMATLPVIVARSTWTGGTALASPSTQRTASAPGLARATSSEAAAGSTPTTSSPAAASRQANVPVPQPTSSTDRAPSSSTSAA